MKPRRFVRPQQEDDFIFPSNFLGGRVTAEESVARLESILTSLIGHRGGGQVPPPNTEKENPKKTLGSLAMPRCCRCGR